MGTPLQDAEDADVGSQAEPSDYPDPTDGLEETLQDTETPATCQWLASFCFQKTQSNVVWKNTLNFKQWIGLLIL